MIFPINIVDVLSSLIIAIITAIITARLALGHFYRKEIWLRKESKYSEIINELCKMLQFMEKEYDYLVYGEATDDNYEALRAAYKKAKLELEKIRYSTGFIINPAVNDVIDKMMKDFEFKTDNERQGDYFSYTDRIYGVIKDAISKIIDIANEDLKKNKKI